VADGFGRDLQRRFVAGDDSVALDLARYRRRSTSAGLATRDYHLVCGELLAVTLRQALDGRREIELLREAEVDERVACRWIRALRDLIAGTPRSFIWVERWASLLGVAVGTLGAASEIA
jgi:hypothetical protein